MKEKYIEDIKEIKDIMNRSSRFISLSGFSGISAGITALVGAYFANSMIFSRNDYLVFNSVNPPAEELTNLLLIALGTMTVSIALVIYLTTRETKRRNLKVWDQQTRRVLINLFIPLVAGGIVCLLFLLKGYLGIVVALTLVFYGLALVNVSKYTLDEIRSLGIIEIVLGILALQFVNYALIVWAIGFGALHILYGIIVKVKYNK